MQLESLSDLYITLLKDIYNAEKQLVKALPKMAKAATSEDLKEAFENHLEETKKQVERLDQVFTDLGKRASGETCEAMEGLVKEAQELIDKDIEDEVLDAGLIASAQKVEHYEIASYGTACEYARVLGHKKQEKLLAETLKEEKNADKLLTELAETSINAMAKAA